MRSIVLNLGVFLADNNLRRSVGAFNVNYEANSTDTQINRTLQPEDVYEYTLPTEGENKLLFIKTSDELEDEVQIEIASSYAVVIQSLHVVDFPILSVTFTNSGTAPVDLYLIQVNSPTV